jgi:hypothetical protein
MRVAIILGLLFVLGQVSAHAESETLLPLTSKSFPSDFKRALAKLAISDPIASLGCLEGAPDKREVCNYRIGDFMNVMAATDKGGAEITIITLICVPKGEADSAKCFLAYSAAMTMAGGEAASEDKHKILAALIDGLSLGKEVMILTDDRKFLLQKSMGLWLHIIAADSEQAQ